MGKCLKGKPEAKVKPGNFRCKKCGAVSSRKDHLCDPKKLKKEDTKEKKK